MSQNSHSQDGGETEFRFQYIYLLRKQNSLLLQPKLADLGQEKCRAAGPIGSTMPVCFANEAEFTAPSHYLLFGEREPPQTIRRDFGFSLR
jgi:hypothetical protein